MTSCSRASPADAGDRHPRAPCAEAGTLRCNSDRTTVIYWRRTNRIAAGLGVAKALPALRPVQQNIISDERDDLVRRRASSSADDWIGFGFIPDDGGEDESDESSRHGRNET